MTPASDAVDQDDALDRGHQPLRGEHDGQEVPLGDDDAIARVGELMGDLRRAGRVVDRERRRAEMQDRHVEQVELGAVEEHQADGVAALHTERGQPRGDLLDAPAYSPPGQRDGVAGVAQRDRVGRWAAVYWNAWTSVGASSASGLAATAGAAWTSIPPTLTGRRHPLNHRRRG